LVPYEVGKWQHVVVVYDPVDVIHATVTIYIDGVAANTQTWSGGGSGTEPGYTPVTGDHDPAEAVNGQPALSIGNYNNANSGVNPYFGAVDEFALYHAKLTPEQILAHYQNGTNASRSQPYPSLILSDNPVAYLRLDELVSPTDNAINLGDVRNAGLATHTAEVRHPAAGALAGRPDDGSAAYHKRNGTSTTTVPYLAENNPGAGVPFTFETWVRPMMDQQGGQCPVNNRWVGGSGRTGWVIFQRNPNLSYPSSEGHGWNFRMYGGVGTSGGSEDLVTDTDYTIGKWQHLVFTWEPDTDNGDPANNGNNQWQGTLTAYVDGVAVKTARPIYAANRQETETGGAAADLAIGSYNAVSGLGNNPYEGQVDEVAIYNNYILTPDQIEAHYEAGTNSNYGTNYETLVMTAAFTGPERVGLPKTYLHFSDPPFYRAANSGRLGSIADGNLNVTINNVSGPESPDYPGFPPPNWAVPLNGSKSWVSLNNPTGLNISGQITLEAWIKPGASQADPARIISHGPPTLSSFLSATPPDGAITNGAEVFLAIDGGGANYIAGSSDGTISNSVSFPIPAGDLGGDNWIHLAATYDGSEWTLFRNGILVATASSIDGAFPVDNADWAIGSTGNGWQNLFTGSIDEAAIYNVALSQSQIASHYSLGQYGSRPLTIARSGPNVVITWANGILQHANKITGPYTDVGPSAAPPSYSTAATQPAQFYRLRF
jgi:hypothetical protein